MVATILEVSDVPGRLEVHPDLSLMALGPGSTRGGLLLLACRAGERLRVQRPLARSRVRGGASDTDEIIRVSSKRPAAIGACPSSTGGRRCRPVI